MKKKTYNFESLTYHSNDGIEQHFLLHQGNDFENTFNELVKFHQINVAELLLLTI